MTEKAYNTSNLEQTVSLYFTVKEQMCDTRWTDRSSFESKASSFGIDFENAEYVFGLTSSDRNRSESYAQAYRQLCSLVERDYAQFLNVRYIEVDASDAVDAWRDCETATSGLFALVTVNPYLDRFNVRFTNQTEVGSYEILSIQPSADIRCNIGPEEINPTPQNPVQIEPRTFSIDCSKEPTKTVTASFNSSIGGAFAFTVNGSFFTREDADRLSEKVEELTGELSAVMSELTELKRSDAFLFTKHVQGIRPGARTTATNLDCRDGNHESGGTYAGYAGFKVDSAFRAHMFVRVAGVSTTPNRRRVRIEIWNGAGDHRPDGAGTFFALCQGPINSEEEEATFVEEE